MQGIEQAVFTAVETEDAVEYRVVSHSSGICSQDLKELAVWSGANDALLDVCADAESLNFHPLPSGAYCVSRTIRTEEPGGVIGPRLLTHCLIVPPKILSRFGNNPFALASSVSADGLWRSGLAPHSDLESFVLTGGDSAVDERLLEHLATNPGAWSMAALVQTAMDAAFLAVGGPLSAKELLAGLFSCLPLECRLEFSFSTGLKFSPRRPFRIVALSGDAAEHAWMAHYPNVAVLQLPRDALSPEFPLNGWAQFIQRTLSGGGISFLAAQISKRRFHLTLNDLSALGLQLLDRWEASPADHRGESGMAPGRPILSGQRADGAHARFYGVIPSTLTTASRMAPPSKAADTSDPHVLEKLELLDDLVYEAIHGEADSLMKLRIVWPQLAGEVDQGLLAESQEQYLRYALSLWNECVDSSDPRQPVLAIQALDVLCVLFGDAV